MRTSKCAFANVIYAPIPPLARGTKWWKKKVIKGVRKEKRRKKRRKRNIVAFGRVCVLEIVGDIFPFFFFFFFFPPSAIQLEDISRDRDPSPTPEGYAVSHGRQERGRREKEPSEREIVI